ncbi:MAG: hypothetical protein HFI42_12175 [Lachnospiraceae bacterium]|nr:hypothetical protein [Lachnospiraceae bacterium]
MKKNKHKSRWRRELKQDLATLKNLSLRDRFVFIWDYYKWPMITLCFLIFVVCLFAHMLWEGQKPCRLRVCVVLNTEQSCSLWFRSFTEELTADGKPGAVDVNQDQPFDYDNSYYYVHEIEVMTTISSGRMDFAICGSDMYSYLLALNACLPLDTALSEDLAEALLKEGRLVYSTANLTVDEDGNSNPADGIDGYYAVDLAETPFSAAYNQTEEEEPLYAVIISNTEHLADCEALLRALTGKADLHSEGL